MYMKKFKLPVSADLFFTFIGIFCIFYAVFIKNKLSFILSALLSAILSLILTTLIAIIIIIIYDKKELNSFISTEKENLNTYLTFLPREKLLEFFINVFKNDKLSLEIFNDGLICKDKKIYIYPIFNAVDTTKQNVVDAYLKKEDNSIVIISGSYDSSALNLPSVVEGLTIYNINDLYLTLKKLNALPNIKTTPINKRKRFIATLKGLFNKKHAKFFFISGIVSLLTSTLTYFKGYYIFLGTSFLILSAICKFFAPATQKPNGIEL